MSSGSPSGMPCCIIAFFWSTLAVTATFTMAGVTRAATVSIAWSSDRQRRNLIVVERRCVRSRRSARRGRLDEVIGAEPGDHGKCQDREPPCAVWRMCVYLRFIRS